MEGKKPKPKGYWDQVIMSIHFAIGRMRKKLIVILDPAEAQRRKEARSAKWKANFHLRMENPIYRDKWMKNLKCTEERTKKTHETKRKNRAADPEKYKAIDMATGKKAGETVKRKYQEDPEYAARRRAVSVANGKFSAPLMNATKKRKCEEDPEYANYIKGISALGGLNAASTTSARLKHLWKNDPVWIAKMKSVNSKFLTELMNDPAKREEVLRKGAITLNNRPNRCEAKMLTLLLEIDPTFRYTGDFAFWIRDEHGSMNPDFIYNGSDDINVCLEYDGEHWHQDKEKAARRLIRLAEAGWCVLVMHKEDIKNPELFKYKIQQFLQECKDNAEIQT